MPIPYTDVLLLIRAESYHVVDPKVLRQRLPLLWFDRLLRHAGPFLPLPVVALRLASDLLMLRGEQHQLSGLQSRRLRGHYTEAAAIYVGMTAVRLVVYFLHCAGGSSVPVSLCSAGVGSVCECR